MLPKLDQNGNQILFHRLADSRPSQYMFNDGIKLLLMSIDANLYTDGCSAGYIFLFDMTGVRLGHLTRLSINSIRMFFEYLQEGLPVRLKAIHVLNAVWFMDKFLALIRPFMKQELYEMVNWLPSIRVRSIVINHFMAYLYERQLFAFLSIFNLIFY